MADTSSSAFPCPTMSDVVVSSASSSSTNSTLSDAPSLSKKFTDGKFNQHLSSTSSALAAPSPPPPHHQLLQRQQLFPVASPLDEHNLQQKGNSTSSTVSPSFIAFASRHRELVKRQLGDDATADRINDALLHMWHQLTPRDQQQFFSEVNLLPPVVVDANISCRGLDDVDTCDDYDPINSRKKQRRSPMSEHANATGMAATATAATGLTSAAATPLSHSRLPKSTKPFKKRFIQAVVGDESSPSTSPSDIHSAHSHVMDVSAAAATTADADDVGATTSTMTPTASPDGTAVTSGTVSASFTTTTAAPAAPPPRGLNLVVTRSISPASMAAAPTASSAEAGASGSNQIQLDSTFPSNHDPHNHHSVRHRHDISGDDVNACHALLQLAESVDCSTVATDQLRPPNVRLLCGESDAGAVANGGSTSPPQRRAPLATAVPMAVDVQGTTTDVTAVAAGDRCLLPVSTLSSGSSGVSSSAASSASEISPTNSVDTSPRPSSPVSSSSQAVGIAAAAVSSAVAGSNSIGGGGSCGGDASLSTTARGEESGGKVAPAVAAVDAHRTFPNTEVPTRTMSRTVAANMEQLQNRLEFKGNRKGGHLFRGSAGGTGSNGGGAGGRSYGGSKFDDLRNVVWGQLALNLLQQDEEKNRHDVSSMTDKDLPLNLSGQCSIREQTIIEHIIENILEEPVVSRDHDRHGHSVDASQWQSAAATTVGGAGRHGDSGGGPRDGGSGYDVAAASSEATAPSNPSQWMAGGSVSSRAGSCGPAPASVGDAKARNAAVAAAAEVNISFLLASSPAPATFNTDVDSHTIMERALQRPNFGLTRSTLPPPQGQTSHMTATAAASTTAAAFPMLAPQHRMSASTFANHQQTAIRRTATTRLDAPSRSAAVDKSATAVQPETNDGAAARVAGVKMRTSAATSAAATCTDMVVVSAGVARH